MPTEVGSTSKILFYQNFDFKFVFKMNNGRFCAILIFLLAYISLYKLIVALLLFFVKRLLHL